MLGIDPIDRPVFVVGERLAGETLARRLAEGPDLALVEGKRLLRDLADAVSRCQRGAVPFVLPDLNGLRPPASWYREVQAEHARRAGKDRTVEYSGLAVSRLDELFPSSQFVVVRSFAQGITPSRRMPALTRGRLIQVDSAGAASDRTLARVLDFLAGEDEGLTLDLAERALSGSGAVPV